MEHTLRNNDAQGKQEEARVITTLSDTQKKALMNGTLVIGGIITGGALHAMYNKDQGLVEHDFAPIEESVVTTINDAPEVCASVYDEMSFGDAFSTARADVGAGGVFEWKGNLYNTYTEEEWDAFTAEDQGQYVDAITPIVQEQNNVVIASAEPTVIEADPVVEESTEETIEEAEEVAEIESEDELDLNDLLATPVIKGKDLDHDNVIDAIAIDKNNDGYADVVAIDLNADGYADIVGENLDDDIDLDVIIIEGGKVGVADNSHLENDSIVEMDQFDEEIQIDNESDNDEITEVIL